MCGFVIEEGQWQHCGLCSESWNREVEYVCLAHNYGAHGPFCFWVGVLGWLRSYWTCVWIAASEIAVFFKFLRAGFITLPCELNPWADLATLTCRLLARSRFPRDRFVALFCELDRLIVFSWSGRRSWVVGRRLGSFLGLESQVIGV
ncbi:hypothetical protein PVK06_029662 [Gossypium arboreum]|uniref:Uncharacterized protein n=1 Tax=Gossypium arboreum TaxID=29729 RepID=A0ABR0NLF6_GOSAR|nr:hypothetical protein PVK06_029662 [Gossypium arboreum]